MIVIVVRSGPDLNRLVKVSAHESTPEADCCRVLKDYRPGLLIALVLPEIPGAGFAPLGNDTVLPDQQG